MTRPHVFSRALSAVARALFGAASLSLMFASAAGCAEEEATAKPPQTASVDASEQAKIEQGRKKLTDANRAINEKKYDRARTLLTEASALNMESLRFDIGEATEKLDKREAKLWANDAADKLKEKDCLGAVQELSDRMKARTSEVFTRELRRLTAADAQKCLEGALDDKVLASAYADARALANGPEAKAALGASAQKKLAAQLEDTILDALRGQIDDELKGKRWAQAAEKVDAAAKKGDATEQQVDALLASVRAGLTKDILATAARALGQNDAPQALRQIDAQIKIGRWEILPPDAAALAGDKALPEDVARKREQLATWVEIQKVTFTALKRPEKRWAHGKVALTPPSELKGESRRDVAHGAEVWVLGTTKDGHALVTGADPGSGTLTALLGNVIGWAPVDHLAKEPTLDWVVPDDQLKGERVWAPLRKDEPLWELGTVAEVSGKDITVKRVADDVSVKVTRKQLRSGRLAPGTRVVTFCTAKDQPAKIEAVLPNRNVKILCDGGQEKEDVLASLRSKPELLPPTK